MRISAYFFIISCLNVSFHKICEGQIQRHIGESFAEYQAGRAFVYDLAQKMDLHSQTGARCDSDATKLYCSTMAKNVADRAIQSMGGYGYVGELNTK